MSLSVRQKRKLRISSGIIATGTGLGLFYAFLSDGFTSWFPFINGAITGSIVGFVISILELLVFDNRVRKLRFIALVLLRTSLYVIFIPTVIFLELITARVIRFGMSYQEIYNSEEFQNYLLKEDFLVAIVYTVGLAFLVNFTYQVSRKMGQGMLWSYISGKYKRPVTEDRVLMFVRLANANKVINELGSSKFLQFLNEVIFDITEPVLLYHGIIYEYVEDECVISWEMDDAVRNANCLRAIFEVQKVIDRKQKSYLSTYGLIPALEIALHTGTVLQTEVGSLKSEIAFYGDVMNITSRILAKCPELSSNILISNELIYKMEPSTFYSSESKGEFILKGRSQPIELFSISK